MKNNVVGGSTKENLQKRKEVFDGYDTPPYAIHELLKKMNFHKNIWEPAAGHLAISEILKDYGYSVYSSDIYPWDERLDEVKRFENYENTPFDECDIVTNPPFVHAKTFIEVGMKLLNPGRKLALLLRLQFLESKNRKKMFEEYPPQLFIFSDRIPRMHRYNYEGKKSDSTNQAFAWFIFEKDYHGESTNKWI